MMMSYMQVCATTFTFNNWGYSRRNSEDSVKKDAGTCAYNFYTVGSLQVNPLVYMKINVYNYD